MITKKLKKTNGEENAPAPKPPQSAFDLEKLEDSIAKHFTRNTSMTLRYLWTNLDNSEQFRVNWYDVDMVMIYSRFIRVSSTPDGFLIEDQTHASEKKVR